MTIASGDVLGRNSHRDQTRRHEKTIRNLMSMCVIHMTVASGDVVGCNSHGDQTLGHPKPIRFWNPMCLISMTLASGFIVWLAAQKNEGEALRALGALESSESHGKPAASQ